MTELSIKDYIRNGLFFEAQSVALDFVSFLEEKGVDFYKDNCDCWKDKIYISVNSTIVVYALFQSKTPMSRKIYGLYGLMI